MAAASDQHYRSQRTLDLIFALSCLAMLGGLLWLFYDDQYRDWKKEQRNFRTVEEAVAQRGLLSLAPDDSQIIAIDEAQEAVYRARLTLDRKKALLHGQADEVSKSLDLSNQLEATDKGQVDAAKANLEAAEAAAYAHEMEIKKAKEELKKPADDLRKASEELKGPAKELEEASKALKAAKEEKVVDEAKVKELQGKIKELTAKVAAPKQKSADAAKSMAPIQERITELEKKAPELAATAQKEKAAYQRWQRRYELAQELVKNATADLEAVRGVKTTVDGLVAARVKSEQRFQDIKADLDARVSDYDIAVDQFNAATDPSIKESLKKETERIKKDVASLKDRLQKAQDQVDANKGNLADAMKPQTEAEKTLSEAEDKLKVLTADFDRFHKLVEQKKWGTGDWFRSLPVIDAFASPIKIQQTTLDDLTIDYSFKRVTRYDRCTTCHLGIDRPAYQKENLRDLALDPTDEAQAQDKRRVKQLERLLEMKQLTYAQQAELDELKRRIERRGQQLSQMKNAKESLVKRQAIARTNGFDPNDLKLARVQLTDTQVNEYAAHPRLDLFVDANSPHPAEKFGCTICHAGQGSSTSFGKADHTPDNATQKKRWAKEMGWAHDHDWEFPMLPNRFVESSCLKCHHQVTDLIRDGNRVEAPKLVRGYNLVRDNGCFGCHEIAGIKGGRWVGPDMRLEPSPPLDAYTPAERAKQFSDPVNPPGTLRKVGPSLKRVSEKTNAEWLRKWLKDPRNFRPDTKMPHFYGLSNNDAVALKGTGQEAFPDAEINAIAHYLLEESKAYLGGTDKFHKAQEDRLKELTAKPPEQRSERETREIEEITRRLELFATPIPLKELMPTLPEEPKEKAAIEAQQKRGRELFSEKGCLACHANGATNKPGDGLPALVGDANFGPNLSRLSAKLGTGDKDSARRWLVQWIVNPMIYHPRTSMPVTHLDATQANDVAAWLLAQKTDWKGPDVPTPDTETLKKLVRVHLERGYSSGQVATLLDKGFSKERVKTMRFDQDERELEGPLTDDKLKMFIGKKAIGNMGCFACHDISGFENSKPIGTPLNDWGKKDAERLAFEDASAYVRKNNYISERAFDKDGKAPAVKDGKVPYEKYFYDALEHHQREGFLQQKLREPRSFDYDRLRNWDDRLRMPQFKFARAVQRDKESAEAFEARSLKEEAEAREAVMTFVLGLVAEPVPVKYVHQPTPERLAEAKGRKVLEKFNCNGCHLVRPGIYEFKVTPESIATLMASHGILKESLAADHRFPEHNAWAGTPPVRPDRLTAFAINPVVLKDPDEPKKVEFMVQLTQSMRFPIKDDKGKETWLDLPSFASARVPQQDVLSRTAPFGGTFGNRLVSYLSAKDKQKYPPDQKLDDDAPDDSSKARPAVPPALLRQGEKTQPNWLFQFLKNPEPIRPLVILRMPKFNLSDEDALSLVNYFAAADKIANPGVGLHYPYFSVPERDDAYLTRRTAEYVERLKRDKQFEGRQKELIPIFEAVVKNQLDDARLKQKSAEERIKEAKAALDKETKDDEKKKLADAVKAAEEERDAAEKQVKALDAELAKKEFTSMLSQWQTKDAYLADSFRLVANQNLCLTCHTVGNIAAKEQQGPPLALAWQRLRPEYTERWIAHPQRFMTYSSPMPINFPSNKVQYQEAFVGSSREQITAARDFLMNFPRAMDMPINRNRPILSLPPPPPSGGK